MHGSKAPGGNKLPPALPHLQVGLSQKTSEVHTDHPTSTTPVFQKPFTVIVIFTTQMRYTDCSFLAKYRRQAGLKGTNWRDETSPL